MVLNVWEHGRLVGTLESTPNQGVLFQYASTATRRISASLPLSDKVYSQKECLPFFSGLLPDGDQRVRMAKAVHVSSESVIRLLQNYGRDIAGSLQILPQEESPDDNSSYIPISEAEIERKILSSATVPLMANQNESIRLSLAGAMDKMPLYKNDTGWFLPSGAAASNVIIKPDGEYAANEFVCSLIAKACGLNVPQTSLNYFGAQPTFVSKRFDRIEENGVVKRLHQEDFCQALGVDPEKKYEEDGGPGYKDCLSLIVAESALPLIDVRRFLECAVFNYLLGNCDAHAKNFSLLYALENTRKPRLAPFYDLVCSTIYPDLSRRMAMKAGKHRDIDRITKEDLLSIDDDSKLMRAVLKDVTSKFAAALDSLDGTIPDGVKPLFERIASDCRSRVNRIND
ncbi:MAG: type II toxin-antitoxin system HipA family toxin [Sphaerochaetaceae bacterium]|nr:type II toxin-antitoxin system HipA family toxin [Sphaerochaetaceae bacterium]